MVNNLEQPTDTPDIEGATAVKEAVVEDATVIKEESPVEDGAAKKKTAKKRRTAAKKRRTAAKKKTDASDEFVIEEGQTPAEIAESIKNAGVEIKDKVKEAGMRPVHELFASITSQILSVVSGVLDGLEPTRKKKGKNWAGCLDIH